MNYLKSQIRIVKKYPDMMVQCQVKLKALKSYSANKGNKEKLNRKKKRTKLSRPDQHFCYIKKNGNSNFIAVI